MGKDTAPTCIPGCTYIKLTKGQKILSLLFPKTKDEMLEMLAATTEEATTIRRSMTHRPDRIDRPTPLRMQDTITKIDKTPRVAVWDHQVRRCVGVEGVRVVETN